MLLYLEAPFAPHLLHRHRTGWWSLPRCASHLGLSPATAVGRQTTKHAERRQVLRSPRCSHPLPLNVDGLVLGVTLLCSVRVGTGGQCASMAQREAEVKMPLMLPCPSTHPDRAKFSLQAGSPQSPLKGGYKEWTPTQLQVGSDTS